MATKQFGVLGFSRGRSLIRLRFNMDIESNLRKIIIRYGIDCKREIWTNTKGVSHIVLIGEASREQLDALKKLTK